MTERAPHHPQTRPTRFAIVATHPIQYHAPWFKAMAVHPALQPHIYFCHVATPQEQARAGFGVAFDWDVPLLEGYPYTVLRNRADSTSRGFTSLDTPEIGEIIAREKYDAVIALGWQFKSYWQAIWACWRTRTPIMIRGDSHLHTERSLWKRLGKWAPYRAIMPRFNAYLAAGSWSCEYFRHYGAPRNRIFHVPHVIDRDTFTERAAALRTTRPALRERWGLKSDQSVYLFAAKFTNVKRPMDFVRAVEQATPRDRRVAGLMVGDGPLRSECEEYVCARGVPIQFAGFLNQSEIVEAYVAADALVLLSDETWGMVVNEAFACGLPCIVSDRVGCVPDLILGLGTGSVFPYADVDSLSKMLAYYSSDRATLAVMGERALRRSAGFTPAVAVDGVVKALASTTRTGRHDASFS